MTDLTDTTQVDVDTRGERTLSLSSNIEMGPGDMPTSPMSIMSLDTVDVALGTDNFNYSQNGLTSAEADALYAKWGPNALPEKVVSKLYLFLSQLWQPMPIMIWLAIIIEIAIYNWTDMGILIFIQLANASIGYVQHCYFSFVSQLISSYPCFIFSFYELNKAEDAVAKLKASLQARATVCRDGKFVEVAASVLVPGDLVILAAGSCVPADCRVNPCGKPGISLIDVDESYVPVPKPFLLNTHIDKVSVCNTQGYERRISAKRQA
jgi:magnesium-transporting ATPase (P-type)